MLSDKRRPPICEVLAQRPGREDLRRPDVLPVGDLGIRKAIMILYGLPALPGAAEIIKIGEPWRPYRTLACLYLWRSLHTTPV